MLRKIQNKSHVLVDQMKPFLALSLKHCDSALQFFLIQGAFLPLNLLAFFLFIIIDGDLIKLG